MAAPIRIIVLDKLAPEGLALLEQAEGVEFDVRTGLKGTTSAKHWQSTTERSAAAV